MNPGEVGEAVGRIRAWGERVGWCGYDPYDGLTSPLARIPPVASVTGRRVLTQAVKLSPINLRPVLGIKPAHGPKAVALVASGYARLACVQGPQSEAAARARSWMTWLVDHADARTQRGVAWGYHFDVQTRVFGYRAGTPNTIATAFAAQAFLDGAEHLAEERWLAPAVAASRFLADGMLAAEGARAYFTYLPGERELVHNANALACAVLARTGRLTGDPELIAIAESALQVTLKAQAADGSWPYAEGRGHGWIDNFHTAYVLESLAECAKALGGIESALLEGASFWHRRMFLADGTPKYFVDKLYPKDAHCYASAIDAWLALSSVRDDALERAGHVAERLIADMLHPSGYVLFQRRRLVVNRTPLIRWSTAPAFKALAGLLAAQGADAVVSAQ